MKKVATLLFCCFSTLCFAQQSVSIGSTQTKSGAVLYLSSSGKNQGLIIPIVTSRNSIGGTGAEAGMIVFDETDDALFYYDGTDWINVGGTSAVETDGVIGNEVTQANATRGGLEVTGTGTVASPLTVGIIPGTANGQVLKWNSTLSRWELGTDNTGTPTVDNISVGLNGSTQLEVKNLGVTTAKIADGAVTDIKVATGISGSKINPNFAGQSIITTGNLTAAVGTFSSNVNIRGLNYTWPAANATGVLSNNGTGTLSWSPAGTVSSVGLALPAIFTVTGSPITGTGTLTGTLASQTAATVFAAPTGAAGVPSFRTLAATDIPVLDVAKISTGNWPFGRITGAGPGVRAILGSDNNTVSWVTGSPNQLLGTDGAGALQFVNMSSFVFATSNVVPKGGGSGLIASNIQDNGSVVSVSTDNSVFRIEDNVNNAANSAYLEFGYNDGSFQRTGWLSKPGSGDYLEIGSPDQIHFTTNFTPRLMITSTGEVGIGTTPTLNYDLHIGGSNPSLVIEETGTSNANIIFQRAGVQRWYLLENFGSPTDNIAFYDATVGQKVLQIAQGNGPVTVTNYTKLGSAAPSVQMKKITGTTNAASNGTANIPHGLSAAKILSVDVHIEYTPGFFVPTDYNYLPGYEADYYIGSTDIVIRNIGGNDGSILNKPVKILITYEE